VPSNEENVINDWWMDEDGPAGTIAPRSDEPISALLPLCAIMAIAGGLSGVMSWSIVGLLVALSMSATLAAKKTPPELAR
jgi:hypothetical protein